MIRQQSGTVPGRKSLRDRHGRAQQAVAGQPGEDSVLERANAMAECQGRYSRQILSLFWLQAYP